jgi:anthranilate phosphoribosyltransferase
MLAQASARLGIERAFVVHGSDGLDEITTTGATTVFQVEDGRVQKGLWSPVDFGLRRAEIEDLRGGDADENAAFIHAILDGEPGPKRDVVVANAAAALLAGRRAEDLKSAVYLAAEAIDSGAAREKLKLLAEFSCQTEHESV